MPGFDRTGPSGEGPRKDKIYSPELTGLTASSGQAGF